MNEVERIRQRIKGLQFTEAVAIISKSKLHVIDKEMLIDEIRISSLEQYEN